MVNRCDWYVRRLSFLIQLSSCHWHPIIFVFKEASLTYYIDPSRARADKPASSACLPAAADFSACVTFLLHKVKIVRSIGPIKCPKNSGLAMVLKLLHRDQPPDQYDTFHRNEDGLSFP